LQNSSQDRLEEVKVLQEIVYNHEKETFRLGIRCNYDVNDGVISRFGFDVESPDFAEVLSFVTETANVEFVNLQCHFAKRQLEYWPSRAKGMIGLVILYEENKLQKIIFCVKGLKDYIRKKMGKYEDGK